MARSALALALLAASAAGAQPADPILKLYEDGRAALAAGRLDEAQELLEGAVQLAGKRFSLDHPNAATLTYELGEVALARGDWARAEAEYARALKVRLKHLGPEHASTANALDRLGEAHLGRGRFAEAEPLMLRALEVRLRVPDGNNDLILRSYANLGRLHDDAGRYARAESFRGKALAYAEKKYGADGLPTAVALNALALAQMHAGRMKEADANLQRCLAIAEAKGKGGPAAEAFYGNMAVVHEALGRGAEAEALYRKSLALAEASKGPDDPATALALNQLAQHLAKAGRFERAEELTLRALAIFGGKAGADDLRTVQTAHNLGMIHLQMGDYNRAEVRIAASLKAAEARLGPAHPTVAAMLNNLAFLHSQVPQYDRAEPLYLRALAIREEALGPTHPATATVLVNLGDLEAQRRNYDRAAAHYGRALKALDRPDEPESPALAELLSNLYRLGIDRDARADLGLLERSYRIFERHYGPSHPNSARVRYNVGFGYYSAQKYAEAEIAVGESLTLLRESLGETHPAAIDAARVLALAQYARNERPEALRTMDRARRAARRHVDLVLPGLAPDDRRSFLKRADAVALSQALTMGLENAGSAEFAEASAAWLANGKATVAEAEARAAQAANAGDSPEARDLRDVRRELAGLALADRAAADGRAARRREELLDRDKALTARLRAAGGRLGRPTPWAEFDAVRRGIPEGAVLVDVVRLDVARLVPEAGKRLLKEPHYAAWVTPKVGPVRVVDLGPASRIETLVAAVRDGLAAGPKAIGTLGEPAAEKELRAALAAAAEAVLHPLLSHLGGAEAVVLSPDGALWLLPWAALPLPDGKYAVERFAIRHVVGARELAAPAEAPAATTAPLVVADPDFDLDPAEAAREGPAPAGSRPPAEPDARGLSRRLGLGRVGRLAGTAAEAEAVAPRLERWLGTKPRVLTDRQALKASVKAARSPQALVLSTHGYFRPDQEVEVRDPAAAGEGGRARTKDGRALEDPLLRCGLLFAACNRAGETAAGAENGILTGLEVVGCDLRGTKLVVLSACETGLGEVRNGEGVAGLRQAFQLAGAESVAATLWQIPDLPSAQLMTAYFDRLAAGRPRDAALAEAQRGAVARRRERFGAAHPFYWAAYTLTGRAR